jgi:thiamine pyrophosphate-dependent acetolactate synthase large subunit-like protein
MSKANLLERRSVVSALLAGRKGAIAIGGLGASTYDIAATGDHDRNFYLWGAMGGAAMMGLGLAQAQPRRPVLVITGDGEQLMGVGSLLTIAAHAPANLSIAVLDNGHFGETGMQRSHSGLGARLDAIAKGAGFQSTVEITDMDGIAAFRSDVKRLSGGPKLALIRISTMHVDRALPPRDGVFLKNRFRQHLGIAVI